MPSQLQQVRHLAYAQILASNVGNEGMSGVVVRCIKEVLSNSSVSHPIQQGLPSGARVMAMRRRIGLLTINQQAVLKIYYIDGKSIEEACRATDISVDHFKALKASLRFESRRM